MAWRHGPMKKWLDEFGTSFLSEKNEDGTAAEPRENELNTLMGSQKALQSYQDRLSDISWLMRQLAEFVASQAQARIAAKGSLPSEELPLPSSFSPSSMSQLAELHPLCQHNWAISIGTS